MTEKEFKDEILLSNPDAVFIDQGFRLVCTPTPVEFIMLHDVSKQIGKAFELHRNGQCIYVDFEDKAVRVHSITAILPKKKRLMTPAECAGKWMCKIDGRHFISAIKGNEVKAGGSLYSIPFWHSEGFKIADTPTSEPYSLEVEE